MSWNKLQIVSTPLSIFKQHQSWYTSENAILGAQKEGFLSKSIFLKQNRSRSNSSLALQKSCQ